MKKLLLKIRDGAINNNPTFRLMLGTCPTLAVTTSLINGLAMGLCTASVLIVSNILISMLRARIPDKIRIPCYVLIIATLVTVVQMFMRKFLPDLFESLGLFLPLIVVNCIILARAEAFAGMNPVGASALDGIAVGLGFTMSLSLIGFVRELIGAGSIAGQAIPALQGYAIGMLVLPAGGFLTYAIMMVLFNYVMKKLSAKKAPPAVSKNEKAPPAITQEEAHKC